MGGAIVTNKKKENNRVLMPTRTKTSEALGLGGLLKVQKEQNLSFWAFNDENHVTGLILKAFSDNSSWSLGWAQCSVEYPDLMIFCWDQSQIYWPTECMKVNVNITHWG